MVMMYQQQMRQYERDINDNHHTIEQLQEEIANTKMQRQTDQMLIHRLRMEIQQVQFNMYYAQQDTQMRHQVGTPHKNTVCNYKLMGNTRKRSSQSKSTSTIDVDAIQDGNDTRTTVMVCNIPNRYTRDELVTELESKPGIKGAFDFLYLPIDFKNNCNLGYAFINMTSPCGVCQLYTCMHGTQWKLSIRSSKICKLKWGRVQGKAALLNHFKESVHLNETPSEFKPITVKVDSSGETICNVVD